MDGTAVTGATGTESGLRAVSNQARLPKLGLHRGTQHIGMALTRPDLRGSFKDRVFESFEARSWVLRPRRERPKLIGQR